MQMTDFQDRVSFSGQEGFKQKSSQGSFYNDDLNSNQPQSNIFFVFSGHVSNQDGDSKQALKGWHSDEPTGLVLQLLKDKLPGHRKSGKKKHNRQGDPSSKKMFSIGALKIVMIIYHP